MRSVVAALSLLLTAASALAVDADLRKLAKDPDSFKRSDAARALAKDGSADAARLLLVLLADRNPYVRDHTVAACRNVSAEDAVGILAGGARDKDELVRRNVAEALGRTRADAALVTIAKLASTDRSGAVRAAALDALWGFRENARATGIAIQALGDDDALVRAAAIEALGRIRAAEAPMLCERALGDVDEGVRCVARMELRFVAEETARADLVTAAADAGWRTRSQAVENAYWLRDNLAMEALVVLVGDERLRVSAAAHRALVDLSGKQLGRDADLWRAWWEQNAATWLAPSREKGRRPPEPPGGTRARYHGVEVLSDDLVFVLDASGSMRNEVEGGTTRWQAALAELRTTLAALPDGARVNVIFFQHEVTSAFETPTPLAKKSRKVLDTFLKRTNPGQAGNLLDAMLTALEQPDVDTVYVLSDGAPSYGDMVVKDRVRARIRALNRSRKATVNCIGFGAEKATERSFLEKLARDSMGTAVFR